MQVTKCPPALADQGLTVVEVADLLGVTAYEAFHAGARIRTDTDVHAVADTMPPLTVEQRAEAEAFRAKVTAMTVEDIAWQFGTGLGTAARIRDLYTGGAS